MKTHFCIVGKGDVPIYESALTTSFAKPQKEDLMQFVIHAALDNVEQKIWNTNSMLLKNVDKFNDMTVSSFCTAGHVKFMLLHDQRLAMDTNAVSSFFYDAYELYIKIILNPFYQEGDSISSPVFDRRIKALGDKYL